MFQPRGIIEQVYKAYLIVPARARWAGAVFLILLCLLTLARETAIGFYCVQGTSMTPTLLPGDCLLADETAFGDELPFLGSVFSRDTPPSRGELVILALRPDSNPYLIKRIIALPGDTLAMRGGKLYVNRRRLIEPYVSEGKLDPSAALGSWHFSYLLPEKQRHDYQPTGMNWGPIVVPEGAYFVLGDNRDESGDSRGFGFVYYDEIVARPMLLLYSYDPHELALVPLIQNVRMSRIGKSL